MSVDEIVAEVRKFKAEHVVLTGGEPMVAPGIHDLASLSPKLNNSTPEEGSIDAAWIKRHEETRNQSDDILREWIEQAGDYQFKFVISTHDDFIQALAIMRFGFSEVPRWKVQLMPEGIDSATIAKNRAMLIDFCKESGYRLCDRLHIHLFGNTRGT